MKTLWVIFGFGLVIAANVSADTPINGFTKIYGSYAIASESLIDPAPDEKKDRVAFFLTDATAKHIYEQMSAPAKKDGCSSEIRTKTAGGLVCTKDVKRNEYICTFGVMLKTGALVDTSVC